MAVKLSENTVVRDLVVEHPRTRGVLEKFGIDYCCGGDHDIKTAAAEKGVESEKLIKALKESLETPAPGEREERNWSSSTLRELADYIEEHHHTFMKEQLPRLSGLMSTVLGAHGPRHGQTLVPLQETYASLKAEIEQHLMKEEQILFPYIRQIEAYAQGHGEKPAVHCGSIQNPIRQMKLEHNNAGAALERMRDLTSDYALPDDACNTFRALYDGLQALEIDLHEHIHLENNILFPRSVELESKSGVL